MANTDDTTKNTVPATSKRPLMANTPALRNAQRELKRKAELSFHLITMEPLLTENVRLWKKLVHIMTAHVAEMNAEMGGNFRRGSLERAFDTFHKDGQRMSMAGSCEKVWKHDSDLLASFERSEAEKEKFEKGLEKARKKLRILRVRRKYAIRCVKVLKTYLEEVREKQQAMI